MTRQVHVPAIRQLLDQPAALHWGTLARRFLIRRGAIVRTIEERASFGVD